MIRTGRTTRMLKAVMKVMNNKYVIIIGKDLGHLNTLMNQIRKLELKEYPELKGEKKEYVIRYKNGGVLDFRTTHDRGDWDWRSMRFLAINRDTPTYVDHYVIESYI